MLKIFKALLINQNDLTKIVHSEIRTTYTWKTVVIINRIIFKRLNKFKKKNLIRIQFHPQFCKIAVPITSMTWKMNAFWKNIVCKRTDKQMDRITEWPNEMHFAISVWAKVYPSQDYWHQQQWPSSKLARLYHHLHLKNNWYFKQINKQEKYILM